MADPTRRDETPHRKPDQKPDQKPDDDAKGQYGGLTSLGPGGGRPLEEALETEDIDPDADETDRK